MEIDTQLKARGETPPEVVLAPTGSGGTLAGLHVGVARYWPDTQAIGVSVSRDAAWFQHRVAEMAAECAALLGWTDLRFDPAAIRIEDGHVGPGYGQPSEGGNAAIRRLGRTEGVILDPVYTGKAMDGLFSLAKSGAIATGAKVIFIHCGGSPALYPFARVLSES